MPRNKKSKGGKNRKETEPDTRVKRDPRDDESNALKMENERFESYYKAQGFFDEEEWDRFMECMKEPLPTTFRLTGNRNVARELNDVIQTVHIPHLSGVTYEGQEIPAPKQIPWYPDRLAWQLNVSKTIIRKSPQFRQFQNFLVYETEVGNISRQEAVSMIPPLFLDVEPHHIVMDMCAAPGSKTAQIIEAMQSEGPSPTGVLIANDADYKRSHMLVHQSARLPSPALMVTNLDASIYTTIRVPAGGKDPEKTKALTFDRVLCDVPCSGDGTLRKNLGIWKTWQPMNGNGLHSLQVRILVRAMQMLKPGGRIVYSTCSLNPIENEAVVAAALNSLPGVFSIADVSSRLPELVRRPGLTKWKVPVNRKQELFESYDSYIQTLTEKEKKDTKIVESQFTPSNAVELGLERCLRIYPHLQDTGGFFITILTKAESSVSVTEIPPPNEAPSLEAEAEVETGGKRRATEDEPVAAESVKRTKKNDSAPVPAAEGAPISTVTTATSEDTKEKRTGGFYKEAPFTFIPSESSVLQKCLTQLHIKPTFPSTRLFVRNADVKGLRSVYLCNPLIQQIMAHNDYIRLRLVNCGVKVFIRHGSVEDVVPNFRFAEEGVEAVLGDVEEGRIVYGGIEELKLLMESYYPLCESFGEPFRGVIKALPFGSALMQVRPGKWQDIEIRHAITYPVWKSHNSICLMIDKKSKSALSLRLWGKDITEVAQAASEKRKDGIGQAGEETELIPAGNILVDGDEPMDDENV